MNVSNVSPKNWLQVKIICHWILHLSYFSGALKCTLVFNKNIDPPLPDHTYPDLFLDHVSVMVAMPLTIDKSFNELTHIAC